MAGPCRRDRYRASQLRYDPRDLYPQMTTTDRERLEKNFPESNHGDVERHRAIVTGCLGPFDGCVTNDSPIRGVFFLAQNGERQILEKDVHVYRNRSWPAKKVTDLRGRHHVVPIKLGRRVIDKMSYSFGAPHQSEGQWYLPQDHPRHFSKFPLEIRLEILGHVLKVPGHIAPETITCTWKREQQTLGYKVYPSFAERWTELYELCKHKARVPLEDAFGPYTQLRDVFTRPIDATCLRVSRQFWEEGTSILYGRNDFDLSAVPFCVLSHGTVYTIDNLREGLRQHRAQKPAGDEAGWKRVMETVDTLMGGSLPSWAYCDPFLRFLRTIGPTNSSRLETICLHGVVKRHKSGDPLVCDELCGVQRCLGFHLRLYAPFVERYCPSVHKLKLGISSSWCKPEAFYRYLRAILDTETPKFKNLAELVVEANGSSLRDDVVEEEVEGGWSLKEEKAPLMRRHRIGDIASERYKWLPAQMF